MSDMSESMVVPEPLTRPAGWVRVREVRCSGCDVSTVDHDWLTTAEMVRYVTEHIPCASCGGQLTFATEPEETADAR